MSALPLKSLDFPTAPVKPIHHVSQEIWGPDQNGSDLAKSPQQIKDRTHLDSSYSLPNCKVHIALLSHKPNTSRTEILCLECFHDGYGGAGGYFSPKQSNPKAESCKWGLQLHGLRKSLGDVDFCTHVPNWGSMNLMEYNLRASESGYKETSCCSIVLPVRV